MESVLVETISEIGNSIDCQKNPELSDKQREGSGKKKRKSRKRESELKNNDSNTSSQSGNADEVFSSEEKKVGKAEKSTREDQVQLSENRVSTLPQATLPDANKNGSSRKKSKRKKKMKEDSSCEEKMLDDAGKTTNDDQVHLLDTPLLNGTTQEGSNKHTQESSKKPVAAQLCTGPNFSAREDSQPDATSLTSSQKRKRGKKSDRNAPKQTDIDIHSTNAEVAVNYNTITEAEGSKSMSEEVNTVHSVVINSCLKSKDGMVEQQECTDVKLIETVAQTQSPKAKKNKKRKTKTGEVCDPLGKNLKTSKQSGSVECVENNDGNGGRELTSYSASQRESSVTGEESSFQNPGKTKEKETDENTRKRKKKKTSSADHKAADMEVYEPSRSVECLLGHSNEKDIQNCYGNAGQEFEGDDMTSKIEKSTTREKSGVHKSGKHKEMPKVENIESNQDALGAEGVSDIGRKSQKRKIKKKTNRESVATMDSESVQCLLNQSNREGVKNCDGNADGEIASKDLASNIEDSATKGESVQDVVNIKKRKKEKKGEVNQVALGAEGVSKVATKKSKKKEKSLDHKNENVEEDSKNKNDEKGEVDQNAMGAEGGKVEVKTKKSKKKKKSFDHKIDDMEEKDDFSLPRKDEEPECDREKLETSLSSSVLIQNSMAQGVASSETGGVPRCSCEGQRTRKLVVFDLNGILADIVQGFTGQFVPDGKVSYRSGMKESNSLWSLNQTKCTTTKFKTQEKQDKPLFLKDLRTVWDCVGTCSSCGKRKYDETNTLLVDDSPDKALCNPPYTGIFPCPYQYTDRQDSALGPEGELRKYLERLADAENVQKFVAENPFGQTAITETHESWEFYSKVIEAHK